MRVWLGHSGNFMKVITWNVRRATEGSDVWGVLSKSNPDIAILQEVGSLSKEVLDRYQAFSKNPRNRNGNDQTFQTVILTKGKLVSELPLVSEFDWVNSEYTHYSGNIVGHEITTGADERFNVLSVYSPAWHIPNENLRDVDVGVIRLQNNPNLYCTEILWSLLRNSAITNNSNWIVSGDFNSSVTFDATWGAGNQEIVDRMNGLGLRDCLSHYSDTLVPTFRNASNGQVIHQLDYVYVNQPLLSRLGYSKVLDKEGVFENRLSDHLPIETKFR